MKTFGEFIKIKRLEKELTLREFCKIGQLDPSNWSKIERGILSPPKSREVLEAISDILNFKKGSEDYNELFDLAIISHVPSDLIDNKNVVDNLPVFFRTLRGQKPTRKELEELIRLLTEG